MKKQNRKKCLLASCLLAAFLLWTAAVAHVDVRPIGPLNTSVGFASMNRFFHDLTGVHMSLYVLTDWLSLIPAGLAAGFALLGLAQWIQRKSLLQVDRSLLALGVFYLVVLAVYVLFEKWIINYRPVLIEGVLEASYPSSTTLLVMTVMPAAILQFNARIRQKKLRQYVVAATSALCFFIVAGRLLSGVHWLSDIIGSVLISSGLVLIDSCF